MTDEVFEAEDDDPLEVDEEPDDVLLPDEVEVTVDEEVVAEAEAEVLERPAVVDTVDVIVN